MILLYHKVSRHHKTKWYVTDHTFMRQMQFLKDYRMVVVPLQEYDPMNKRHVAITFDGGYDEMYETAVPILRTFQFEYDIFLIGNYVGKDNSFDVIEPHENFLTLEHLRDMVKTGGAHLQWHTNSHKRVDAIDGRSEWLSELTIPQWIHDLDPTGFTFFAYPYGGNAEWQYTEVRKRFKGALFVNGGSDTDIYKLNRTMVFEDTDFNWLLSSSSARLYRRVITCLKEGRVKHAAMLRLKRFLSII